MRHRNSVNHLGRTSSHRKALLSNMANSLLLHKRISTTLAKAKELRTFVEPLITRAKSDSTHNRREVFKNLKSKTVVSELFRDICVKVGERQGGYTRILKTGNRLGDNAEMCIIELVDYNENMLSTPKKEVAKKRRTRSKTTKKADEAPKAVESVEKSE
jgi:large subunit ribosomal protein L17